MKLNSEYKNNRGFRAKGVGLGGGQQMEEN